MRIALKLIVLLLCFIWPVAFYAAETLYLWTDDNDRLHITREAPADSGRIIDTMTFTPQPVKESAAAPPPGTQRKKDPLSVEKCRIAAKARLIAAEARQIAATAKARAEEKRRQARDLKDRVGDDDELLDDYKDNIEALQSEVQQAELFAGQAEIQAGAADLRARQAEAEAGPDCRF
jgi:hypothetical protein